MDPHPSGPPSSVAGAGLHRGERPDGGGGPSAHPRREGARAHRWRFPRAAFALALAFFVGVCLLTYPTAAAWLSQYLQSQRIVDYSGSVDAAGPDARERALRDARAYNDSLSGATATLGEQQRLPSSDGAAASDSSPAYDSLLDADGRGLMARIKIPAIDVDLPVSHGTTDEVLLDGVGHLEGTALPVGGDGTHAVLTAHRGLASAELFSNLDRVEVGDTFVIEVFGEVLTYRVRETRVVQPDETETLHPSVGEDLVTLVTCTPLGVNSHRILVTGERVNPTPAEDVDAAGAPPEVPRAPWWIAWLAAALAALTLYVWRAGRARLPAPPPPASP